MNVLRPWAVSSILLASTAWAQSKPNLEWMVRPVWESQELIGNPSLYQTLVNNDAGFRLSQVSLFVQDPKGHGKEYRFDFSGFGPSPSGRAEVVLRSHTHYDLRFQHREHESVFSMPGYALGDHSSSGHRSETGGTLTFQPLQPLRLNLGYRQQNQTMDLASTLATPGDIFATQSNRERRMKILSTGASFGKRSFQLDFDFRHRTYTGNTLDQLAASAEAGFDPTDLTNLTEYRARRPEEGAVDRARATIALDSGPVSIVARYVRSSATAEVGGRSVQGRTTPGGASQTLENQWKSHADRSMDLGEVLARWNLARPVTVQLTFQVSKDVREGTTDAKETLVSFGIPFETSSQSMTESEVFTRKSGLGLEMGPVGPISVNLGGVYYERTLETGENLPDEQQDDRVEQRGFQFDGSARYRSGPWTLSADHREVRLDESFTALTPGSRSTSCVRGRFSFIEGAYLEGSIRHQSQHSPDNSYEHELDSRSITCGYETSVLNLSAGYAWVDASSRSILLSSESSVFSPSIAFSDDLKDATTHLDATIQLSKALQASARAEWLNVKGDDPYSFSRLEPRLNIRIDSRTQLMLGGYRYSYKDTNSSDRNFTSSGFVIGATLFPGAKPGK